MRLICSFVLCLPLAVITTPVQGVQFVADQVTQTGGHTHRGSLYYRDDMWRIEHNDPGSVEVTIVRKDKGLIWILLSRTRQFATLPFDGSSGVTLERSMVHEIGRETIGTEVLESHDAVSGNRSGRTRVCRLLSMVGGGSAATASHRKKGRRMDRSI